MGESNGMETKLSPARKKDAWIRRPCLTDVQIMRGLRYHLAQALLSHHHRRELAQGQVLTLNLVREDLRLE